jgi:hypothetical protein
VEALLSESGRLGLSRQQIARLGFAHGLEGRGTRRDRRRANEIAAEVQRELLGQLSESVTLERRRGGEVVETESGPVRMKSRDGLKLLHESGAVSSREYQAGVIVREIAERRELELGSQFGNLDRGAASTHGGSDGLVIHRLTVAQNTVMLDAVEARVQGLSRNGRELTMLRLVAVQGRTISAVARGGADRALNTEALKRALAIAAEVLRVR